MSSGNGCQTEKEPLQATITDGLNIVLLPVVELQIGAKRSDEDSYPKRTIPTESNV